MDNLPRLASMVFSAWFVVLAVQEVRELLYYWNNGWNFFENSKISWSTYYNRRSWPFPQRPEDRISNKQRVCFGRPFFIVIVGIFAAVFTHITLHPEQWREEVHGSKVTYHYIGTPQPDGH
ncbi:MAG: hypothetical protein EOR67_05490 [Mesorhizobium sp.]|uniref:hypothetical protein n=1 Tax=Mesorhizobium sp. TaxID=1871066 RepID=UPI000FE65E72|nr:hypothetical protein [Mesorhizobium sp.]RWL83679.1 MAG: hypothetical protein EOR69_13150 [Mesorhizobium sp.]RWL90831.1 MAG: hypothetical protein EOR67_05490 [Mesorhizobium sp.]RWL93317.1 MAG: hypothetical protein EOR70_29160 [Mesorhizobium sp.]TJV69911.1 MAG: hypothetical protein E5X76_21865 [Mesorhizobium sp.]